MIIDETNGLLDEIKAFSKKVNLEENLENTLKRLNIPQYNTHLYKDFAPYSLYFVRKDSDGNFRGNEGVIFHGSHDLFGSGSAPTFSVTIDKTFGWSIHT